MPAPVVAATHGVCLGGGFQIALGADLRVAAPGCRFSVMEAKWGLIPDMSATVTLRELVPEHAESASWCLAVATAHCPGLLGLALNGS